MWIQICGFALFGLVSFLYGYSCGNRKLNSDVMELIDNSEDLVEVHEKAMEFLTLYCLQPDKVDSLKVARLLIDEGILEPEYLDSTF